jgi:hypothetical protein
MGMAVTDRDNGMTTIEVKIFRSVIVPHTTAFALHNINIKEGIYGIESHFLSRRVYSKRVDERIWECWFSNEFIVDE